MLYTKGRSCLCTILLLLLGHRCISKIRNVNISFRKAPPIAQTTPESAREPINHNDHRMHLFARPFWMLGLPYVLHTHPGQQRYSHPAFRDNNSPGS